MTTSDISELFRAIGGVATLAIRHERTACAGHDLRRLIESGFKHVTIRVDSEGAEVEARDVRGRVELAHGTDLFEALSLCGKKFLCTLCNHEWPADHFSLWESPRRCKKCNQQRMANGRSKE